MSWQRLGFVYRPDGSKVWARSHAALPLPLQIEPDVYRIFFSTRDALNRSSVGWADVDLSSTPRVLREASEPVLTPGEDGTFDDNGISIGSLIRTDDGVRLYYMGWNLGVRAAWRNAIGLAQARTALNAFEPYSQGPILDRSPEDPYTLTYPCVIQRSSHDWLMWYGSNVTPNTSNIRHLIKVARSRDGIRWERNREVAIDFAAPGEHVIVRPTVIDFSDGLLMCFASRGEHYRIGAAWSIDGEHWRRLDAVMELGPSISGWDSEMTCYPALFLHRERLWLVYNGNGYGLTGFGLAVWQGPFPYR